ncbi:MAG: hypothetical protein LBT55_05305 [Clostridiaceae bacterium]|nr:hypothetical protein [Clostridiaceae bacterium]
MDNDRVKTAVLECVVELSDTADTELNVIFKEQDGVGCEAYLINGEAFTVLEKGSFPDEKLKKRRRTAMAVTIGIMLAAIIAITVATNV